MRRHCAAVMCVLALLASGCGKKPEPTGGPSRPRPTPKKVLRFWHIITYTDALDKAAKQFAKARQGVEVKVESIANDQYKTKLNVEMASGTPPDIFFTWGGGGLASYAKSGKVLDLTQEMKQDGWGDRFLPSALKFCTRRNKIYAAPLDMSCVPVWYNAEIFEKHGLTPPNTYAELTAVCKKLLAAKMTPFALGNKKRWPGAFYFIYLATRMGGMQPFIDAAARRPGKAFNALPFIRAGELLQGMVDANAFPTGFNGIDDMAARARFLNGKAAMYAMGTWLVALAKKERPEFLPKMKCFPFPAIEEGKGDPDTVVGGVNCAFAISSGCEHPDLAVELLRELTSEAMAKAWIGIGRIPAIKLKQEALAKLPVPTQSAMALLNRANAIQQYYDQYLPPRLAEAHKDTTQGLFAKTLTPGEAADQMEKTAKALSK